MTMHKDVVYILETRRKPKTRWKALPGHSENTLRFGREMKRLRTRELSSSGEEQRLARYERVIVVEN